MSGTGCAVRPWQSPASVPRGPARSSLALASPCTDARVWVREMEAYYVPTVHLYGRRMRL